MNARTGKAQLMLVATIVFTIASLGLKTEQASASVYAIVTASDCQERSCNNFRVSFWGTTIRPYRRGTVCFKGRCLKTKSSSIGLFTADFNNIGPYEDGSKVNAHLRYKGRQHTRKAWIDCGC